MTTRANFLKSELQKIYNFLNVCYEYADYARLENDTRFTAGLKCRSQVRSQARLQVTGHRSQVTGHRSQVRSQVTQKQ